MYLAVLIRPALALLVLALALPALSLPTQAQHRPHARLDRSHVEFVVQPDRTYSETVEMDWTLFTRRGIAARERSAVTFYPNSQSLEVLEAWVTQPDGTRIEVGPGGRFTRPSAAAQGAPGFTGSLTTSIVFPQLREGSRTHIKYRLTQNTPPLLGFNASSEAELEFPAVEDVMEIDAPPDLPLYWRRRGAVEVTDAVEKGRRHIVARMAPTEGEEPERNSVAASDYQPIFLATTLPNLEELGAIYHRQSIGRAEVTPEIAAIAARVVGDRTGIEAARAIYDWVALNIRYVAIYLNPNDGWVPHPAAEVLAHGYGDCKDHVVLMQALLAARGIRAEPAIVDWGTRYDPLPLWHPFQFNHAIIYLPDYDLFSNPTNAYARFEALDRRLSGKQVVIATERGRIARTPPSRPQDNRYVSRRTLRIGPDGAIEGQSEIALSANIDSDMRAAVVSASSNRDLADRLLAFTPEGGFGEIHTTDPRDLAQPFRITASWRSPHGVTFQGGEAFLPVPVGIDPQQPLRLRGLLNATGVRRHPILAGAGDYTWETTIQLPAGTTVLRLPADVDLTTRAGSYTASYARTDNGVRVVRHLIVERDVYDAADYPELARLLYGPIDDARAVLVLNRTETAENHAAGE